MEKKSKVLSCTKEDWSEPDQYGNVIHTVVFENGDHGWYRGTPNGASYFTVGKDVDYVINIVKKTINGKEKEQIWIKKPKKTESVHEDGGYAKLTVDEFKIRAKINCVSSATDYVKDMILGDKVEAKDMEKAIARLIGIMHKQIDNV